MKRIISLLLSFLVLISVITVPAAGASAEENQYFDDGSFIVTGYGSPDDAASEDSTEAAPSADIVSFIRRIIVFIKAFFERFFSNSADKSETVSRTKYVAYYDSKGNLLWTIYLTAEFVYDGKTAECSSVFASNSIKDSDWRLISSEYGKDKNTATGTFVMKQYKLGVPLKEIEKVLTLTCDEKGNVK